MSQSVLLHDPGVGAGPDDDRVLVVLKTPLDARTVKAAFPPDLTLERAIVDMRKALPVHDVDGRRVLDNVDRELSASRVNFLVVRPDSVEDTARTAVLRDIATPVEMRTAKGLRKVPAVAVEIQAYAGVGGFH